MTEYTYMVVYRVIMVRGAFSLDIDAAEPHRQRICSRRGFPFRAGRPRWHAIMQQLASCFRRQIAYQTEQRYPLVGIATRGRAL